MKMERRFYLGVGILAVFLVLGIIVSFGFAKIHDPIATQLDNAASAATAGDLEEGIRLAMQAKDRWQQYWNCTASVADHTPMDEIDNLFAEMEVFAKTKDPEHFAACCAQLAQQVQSVYDAHRPAWPNIL